MFFVLQVLRLSRLRNGSSEGFVKRYDTHLIISINIICVLYFFCEMGFTEA